MRTHHDLIARVQHVLDLVRQGQWPTSFKSVPAGFTAGTARSAKYKCTHWPEPDILIVYGPLDFATFALPDTAVYQRLVAEPPVKCAVAFMHPFMDPAERARRSGSAPTPEYLARVQGALGGAFQVALIPCEHRGPDPLNPDSVVPLFPFDPANLVISDDKRTHLDKLADALQHAVQNTVDSIVEKPIREKLLSGTVLDEREEATPLVENAIRDLLSRDFYPPEKEFTVNGLWRPAKADLYFESRNTTWPRHLLIEVKSKEDPKWPIVQVTEALAYDDNAAVIQIRLWPRQEEARWNKKSTITIINDAKKLMEGTVAVRYAVVAY